MKWKLVPEEIDRDTCRPMLDVWNRCVVELATLETTWPQLVAAAPPLDAEIEEALRYADIVKDVVISRRPEVKLELTKEAQMARALLKVTGRE